MVASASP